MGINGGRSENFVYAWMREVGGATVQVSYRYARYRYASTVPFVASEQQNCVERVL